MPKVFNIPKKTLKVADKKRKREKERQILCFFGEMFLLFSWNSINLLRHSQTLWSKKKKKEKNPIRWTFLFDFVMLYKYLLLGFKPETLTSNDAVKPFLFCSCPNVGCTFLLYFSFQTNSFWISWPLSVYSSITLVYDVMHRHLLQILGHFWQ